MHACVRACRYFGGRCDHFVDYGTWVGDGRAGCCEAVNSLPAQGHQGMSMLSVDLNQDQTAAPDDESKAAEAETDVDDRASGAAAAAAAEAAAGASKTPSEAAEASE